MRKLQAELKKFQGNTFNDTKELAEFIQRNDISFSTSDPFLWFLFVSFVDSRLSRGDGLYYTPEWLVAVFVELSKGISPKFLCDPWAYFGSLVGILNEACNPKQAFAFTKNQQEYALGKLIVPKANWQLGEPLQLLDSAANEFDLVASILPMGAQSDNPLKLTTTSGESIELEDDLGNLVLVSASQRLAFSGVGLFVVTQSFFFSQRSVFRQFGSLGLGIEAALALPSGTFAPYTNISAYLIVVRRKLASRMFVAQLSSDAKANLQIIENLRQGKEGGSLDLGRFVEPESFKGLEVIRISEKISRAEKLFGVKGRLVAEIATAINLGRPGDEFEFPKHENSIYVPLIGNSDVVASPEELSLKKQNYAQVVINPDFANSELVAHFLNSEFGKELRDQIKSGTVIPKINKQTLGELRIFVPDVKTQKQIVEIETRIAVEQNTVLGLQSELGELRRQLWANPRTASSIGQRLSALSRRLGDEIKEHTAERLDQWFETLPFPLASILRAWQATPSQDFKTKHEHLLHFFEGTAEFLGVILLSAFSSNEAIFGAHKQQLQEAMKKQNLSFERATFGTWKLVVEYLGKQTRDLLLENGKKPEDAQNDRAVCADLFSDPSLTLPEALSRKEVAAILSVTNKMRNDWSGHGGVVGQGEAQLRNEQLLAEVQKLREAIADTWAETQLVHALHCRPRRGLFENEVAVLMGSNSEFLKETRPMATWLDVERLYLSKKDPGRALKLLPLVQVSSSPQSAKNACYFFSRIEKDGARFISYHFMDKPELSGQFNDATDAIKFLTKI